MNPELQGYLNGKQGATMGKIIERVIHQQLKRAMNEIDERRRIEYLEGRKMLTEYWDKQRRVYKEETRKIDERLEAEKTESAKKSNSFWKYILGKR